MFCTGSGRTTVDKVQGLIVYDMKRTRTDISTYDYKYMFVRAVHEQHR